MISRTKLVSWAALLAAVFFCMPRASCYLLENASWPPGSVHMVVQLGTPAFVLPDGFTDWNKDAENALAQWNEYLGGVQFTWTEAAPGSGGANHNGINEIVFSSSAYNYNFGNGVLAVTLLNFSGNTFTETDVIFNTANNFSSGITAGNSKDLHRVALHEFGHVLGLDHPDQAHPPQTQPTIMHSTVTGVNALQPDDIAGVQSLYGSPGTTPIGARLANISTRANVGTGDNVLIAGFIIDDQSKQVIMRAIGPSLTVFGIANPLSDPTLELHDGNGALIVTNDNWADTQQSQIQQTGLAPQNSVESAILATLQPGSYTAIVAGNSSGTGVALAEVYDLQVVSGKAGNISTRGNVSTGDNVMIAGFVLNGPDLKNVVVRGIGPGLRTLGVSGTLPDTTIELHNSQGQLVESNTGWQNDVFSAAWIPSFNLTPPDSKDSAIYNQLAPGSYTVILKSPTNASGIGLVEVYDVDSN